MNCDREIISELYGALVLLGADCGLLGIVGSWHANLPAKDVLCGLKAWNEASVAEVKERIGHFEISCHRPADSQAEVPRTVAEVR
jgi:hypothetical protein